MVNLEEESERDAMREKREEEKESKKYKLCLYMFIMQDVNTTCTYVPVHTDIDTYLSTNLTTYLYSRRSAAGSAGRGLASACRHQGKNGRCKSKIPNCRMVLL